MVSMYFLCLIILLVLFSRLCYNPMMTFYIETDRKFTPLQAEFILHSYYTRVNFI